MHCYINIKTFVSEYCYHCHATNFVSHLDTRDSPLEKCDPLIINIMSFIILFIHLTDVKGY